MKIVTTNFRLTDLVEIEGGTGLEFHLFLGREAPVVISTAKYKKIPTWGQLTKDIIEFCVEQKICLAHLAEQGTIQQGNSRSKFAPCAIEMIAERLLTSK